MSTPTDEQARRAVDALTDATRDHPLPNLQHLRQRRQRTRTAGLVVGFVGLLAGTLVVAGSLDRGTTSFIEQPEITDGVEPVTASDAPSPTTPTEATSPEPEVGRPELATATSGDWSRREGGALDGSTTLVAGLVDTGTRFVAVGIDGANVYQGRPRPGVWHSIDGRDWQRVPVADLDAVQPTWDEAGVLMTDVAIEDDGRLVAIGYANFEPETEVVAWTSDDDGRTWTTTSPDDVSLTLTTDAATVDPSSVVFDVPAALVTSAARPTFAATRDDLTVVMASEGSDGQGLVVWRREPVPPRATSTSVEPDAFSCIAAGDIGDGASGWTRLARPPARRVDAPLVPVGRDLVLLADNSVESAPSDTFAYDRDSGRWRCLDQAPHVGERPAVTATDDRVFVWDGSGGWSLDPATGVWVDLGLAPEGATSSPMGTVWTGTEAVVVAGVRRSGSDTGLDGSVAWDATTGAWRRIADPPVALNQAEVVWTGSEVVLFGARLDNNNIAGGTVGLAWDPTTDAWRELPPPGLVPQATTIAMSSDSVVAVDYLLSARRLDPETDIWEDLPDLPLDSGECYPTSDEGSEGQILVDYCGNLALYEPVGASWRAVEPPIFMIGPPVGADDVFFTLDGEGDLWQYLP